MKTYILGLGLILSQSVFAVTDLSKCHGYYLISGSSNSSVAQGFLAQAAQQKILNVEKFRSSPTGSYYASVSAAGRAQEPKAVALLTAFRQRYGATIECNAPLGL